MLCDSPETRDNNFASAQDISTPVKSTDTSKNLPSTAEKLQKSTEEAEDMEEPIYDQQRKADELAAAQAKSSSAATSAANVDEEVKILHVDPDLKTLSVDVRFSSEGRYLMGKHSTTSHHDARAIKWISASSDSSQKRRTEKITTDSCALLLFEILEKTSQGIWNCAYCAVGIAVRCYELYIDEYPKAGFQDHVNTCLCFWIVTQLSRYRTMPCHAEALAELPELDFPDVVNKTKGLELSDKHDLSKYSIMG
jgi:ribosomal protein L37AE/L43A